MKVVIVTGGASGIGRACVEKFLQQSHIVYAFDLSANAIIELREDLKDYENTLRTIECDVSDEIAVKNSVDFVRSKEGRIDILVNNAGIVGPWKKTHQTTPAEWNMVQSVNLGGVFNLSRNVLPHMIEKRSGAIVNISSVAANIGFGGISPYHAAKGAVRAMSRNDAIDYAQHNIRVNCVLPGFILTDMVREEMRHYHGSEEAGLEASKSLQPLNFIGEGKDVAEAVFFLASDAARYITGIDLVVDGGYTAR